jgi:hypothetical protein
MELLDCLYQRAIPVIDHEDANMLGVAGQSGDSLWFVSGAKEVGNDYDGPGMNHL